MALATANYFLKWLSRLIPIKLNILVRWNRTSGNLEIRVPVLGNRLFCAWWLIHFCWDICQDLAASAVRSSLYQCLNRNYDSVCTKSGYKKWFPYHRTADVKPSGIFIISEIIQEKVVYKRVPTCAYQIGSFTISKDGVLSWTERCQEGIGKDHRRKACDTEDVPGNLIWKKIRERSADCGGWQDVLLLQRGWQLCYNVSQ